MVDHLGLLQDLQVRGVRVQFLPVDLVSDGDLDRLEGVQDVELCQVKAGVVVDGIAVLDNNEVCILSVVFLDLKILELGHTEPSTSASATSRRAL